MRTPDTKADFSGENIYVGIDTHKKSWNITALMDSLFSQTFHSPPRAGAVYKYLKTHFPGANYYSAYEAGFAGFWPHYQLQELGINSIVVNPADIPTTGKEKIQKNDARDSRKIARCLRNGELTPIYVPLQESLDDRCLTRYRKTVSKDLVRTKIRIKSFLNLFGYNAPKDLPEGYWSKRRIQWLKDLELPSSLRSTLNGHLRSYEDLKAKEGELKRQIKILSRTPRYRENVELLQGIPGIGETTAMTLLTELENINRFKTLDQFCSFIGLVPSTHASGEKDGTGKMTPRAQAHLRASIVESAWTAARKDPALALVYSKLCRRMNPNKAIIRIARKLLSRIRYVLKNRTPYRFGVIKTETEFA